MLNELCTARFEKHFPIPDEIRDNLDDLDSLVSLRDEAYIYVGGQLLEGNTLLDLWILDAIDIKAQGDFSQVIEFEKHGAPEPVSDGVHNVILAHTCSIDGYDIAARTGIRLPPIARDSVILRIVEPASDVVNASA